jgi:hypothetical protein
VRADRSNPTVVQSSARCSKTARAVEAGTRRPPHWSEHTSRPTISAGNVWCAGSELLSAGPGSISENLCGPSVAPEGPCYCCQLFVGAHSFIVRVVRLRSTILERRLSRGLPACRRHVPCPISNRRDSQLSLDGRSLHDWLPSMTPGCNRAVGDGAAEWRRHYFMTPPLILMPGPAKGRSYARPARQGRRTAAE